MALLAPVFGVVALPLESSPEERSGSGSFRACLSERSEFAGPPLVRVPQWLPL